jgi:dolichol-phosphate mannosyltransferase
VRSKVVLIPTFNERESISKVLMEISTLDCDVIVIDDNSPDGTATFVKNLNRENISVLDHGEKKGIGPAYLAGFEIAIERGYEKIATMDADGSHQIEDLDRMFEVANNCDVVMGTRWISGGSVSNWPTYRRLLSRFGTWYASKCLNLSYKDLTGGLRIYSHESLSQLNLNSISSNGYCFQIEMIRALSTLSVSIQEVPIHFIERTQGSSKMSKNIVAEAFLRTSLWGFKRILGYNADKLHYVK